MAWCVSRWRRARDMGGEPSLGAFFGRKLPEPEQIRDDIPLRRALSRERGRPQSGRAICLQARRFRSVSMFNSDKMDVVGIGSSRRFSASRLNRSRSEETLTADVIVRRRELLNPYGRRNDHEEVDWRAHRRHDVVRALHAFDRRRVQGRTAHLPVQSVAGRLLQGDREVQEGRALYDRLRQCWPRRQLARGRASTR